VAEVRVVVQRVAHAAVRRVESVHDPAAERRMGPADDAAAGRIRPAHDPAAEQRIGPGLVLLAGFRAADDAATVQWMAEKILGLRIFADADGAMNRSVVECGGEILVVPNFTVYGDARKGRRPSFTDAAPPAGAGPCFEAFVGALRAGPVRVAAGFFQAHMHVDITNDGPVTLILDREPA
jgi:D-tyrosyl-tRNA(Tyr) deacylase